MEAAYEAVGVQRDMLVPVSVESLTNGLCRLLGDDAAREARFRELVVNLRAVVSLHYDASHNLIRHSLLRFSEASKPCCPGYHYCIVNSNLFMLLEGSQFAPLTKDEHDRAQTVLHDFNYPVYFDWAKLDPEFIENSPSHPEKTPPTFEAAVSANPMFDEEWDMLRRRVHVFTRGVGMQRQTGYFFKQKLEYYLTEALGWLRGKPTERPMYSRRSQRKSLAYWLDKSQEDGLRRCTRRTIAQVCSDGGPATFFRRVEVCEPTFRNVVVVYKDALPSPCDAADGGHGGSSDRFSSDGGRRAAKLGTQGAAVEALRQLGQGLTLTQGDWESPPASPQGQAKACYGRIQLELYEDVPFVALTGCLPHKVIRLKHLDTLVFGAKLLAGVVFSLLMLKELMNEREGPTQFVTACVLCAILRNAFTVVQGWVTLRSQYEMDVDNWVNRKMVAQGLPVVTQLVDDVKEQELKEMLLAYFVLWAYAERCTQVSAVNMHFATEGERRGVAANSLSEDQVGESAEYFFKTGVGVGVDYEVEDGLRKLVAIGLVERHEPLPTDKEPVERFSMKASPEGWLAKHPHQGVMYGDLSCLRVPPSTLTRREHDLSIDSSMSLRPPGLLRAVPRSAEPAVREG